MVTGALAAPPVPTLLGGAAAEVSQLELPSPELMDLIAQLQHTSQAYIASIDPSDRYHPDYAGQEAEEINAFLCDAEHDAVMALLAFPVRSLADMQAKAQHLLDNDYDIEHLRGATAALLSSMAGTTACPAPSNLAFSNHHPVELGIEELIAAITAETDAFRTAPNNDEGEAITNAALDRVMAAKYALLAVPKQELTKENGTLATDMALALALLHRRWLVMEGDYQCENQQDECRLVDLLLHGTRFDDVPLLWHIDGKTRCSRPTDAELQADWEAR
jgi:hypothetical protein